MGHCVETWEGATIDSALDTRITRKPGDRPVVIQWGRGGRLPAVHLSAFLAAVFVSAEYSNHLVRVCMLVRSISMNNAVSSSPSFSSFAATKVWYALVPLLMLMLATRSSHFASALSLPDASRAVFFLGGFYLARKYFGVLLGTAIAMDFISMAMGGSRACLTPGYLLIVPAFAVLWFGVWRRASA
jgi:hypothetical protein